MSKKRNLIFISLLILGGVFLITSCLPKPPVTEGILKGQIMVPEGSIQAKDLTGQAMADATVNIIDPVTGDIIATTITDANGYYQVFVLEGGPYLLQAIKDGVKVLQITPQVEVGIEYDLGIADCSATAVALIVQAMLDAEDYPDNLADINLTDIAADPDFNDVMSIVCSTIEAGGDPTALAVVQQAVEDFLYPLTPAPPTTPAPTPVQATPTFNPPAGAVAFGTTVTITSAGADAIYYTTDGSNPATSVTGATLAYTAPLTIDAAKTVKALAVKAGYTNSAIGSAAYTQAAATAPSNIVLAVGSTNPVGGVTNVAIPAAGGTDTTGAVTGWVATTADKIKFTVTDTGAAVSTIGINTGPYTSEADYTITAPSGLMIVVTTTETGKVTGVRTFTVTVAAAPVQATPTFNPPAGAVAFGTTVTITSAGADAIYYTTDGSNPATSATGATLAYTAPLTIDAAKTVKAIAVKAGYTNSAIGSAVYTQAATADLTGLALTGSPGNYTFASGTYTYNSVTVANAVANASNLITLEAGVEKTITVVATETGKTAKTYTIKVTRAALTVGDSYAGGIVAYIFQNGDPGYVTGEQHGLIAAAADQSAGVAWSPNYSNTWVAIGETGIALYTGKDNTDRITEFYDNSIYSTFTYAAGIARDYESGGYDDWFLPSLSEMLKLCDNRNAIGGFVAEDYWSSSEHSREYAYYIGNYSSPWWAEEYKNRLKRVRAVRYF
jgi:hypothetical protein